MISFNLICHGMMLYHEMENHCVILIPEIAGHDYLVGSPQPTKAGCLPYPPTALPKGDFILQGIPDGRTPDSFANHCRDYLLIRESAAHVIQTAATRILRIPRPDGISLFRPVPLPNPKAILGNTPAACVVRLPSRLHDVVVFSYDDLPARTILRFGPWYQGQIGSATENLCIYAEEKPPDPALGQAGQKVIPPHPTAINDFLSLNDGTRPDLQLSRVGTADGVPDSPGLGIDPCQLKNLFELRSDATDPTGCTGAAVVRKPY